MFAVTARRIWLRRNDVLLGGLFTHPAQVLCEAKRAVEEFHHVNDGKEGANEQTCAKLLERRLPPPVNMLKVNWDGALNKQAGAVGLGIIVRDENGRFVVACGIKNTMAATLVVVDAMSAFHAVMVGKEMGAMNIMFEWDALQIVNAVNDPLQCDNSFGHFVEDVRRVLRSFNSYVLQHVGREGGK